MVSKDPVTGSSKKMPSISNQVADCCVDDQEASGLRTRFESPHLTLLLTCWLVRYFGTVVLIPTGAVSHGSKDLSMGGSVAAQPVADELPGNGALALQELSEEAFGGQTVSSTLNQDIDCVTVLAHGPPQEVSLPSNRDAGFVRIPGIAQTPLLSSEGLGVVRAEHSTPEPNCLIGDVDSAFSEQVLYVTKAEGKSMLQPHRVPDDLRRKTVALVVGIHLPILSDACSI